MILGYIRVSTEGQAAADRSSLQCQTDIVEGFARMRGIDKFGVQIFTDAGVSGEVKLSFRPGGSELLAAMSAGDTVVASKLDRMFRSASDAIDMFEVFKAKGVELILFDIAGGSPINGPVGKLIMTILAAVADMERLRIMERMDAGRQAKRRKGGCIGNVPFGFRKVGEGRAAMLEPDEKEQFVAGRMNELFQQGLSLKRISELLALAGYVSRTGQPFKPHHIPKIIARETGYDTGAGV